MCCSIYRLIDRDVRCESRTRREEGVEVRDESTYSLRSSTGGLQGERGVEVKGLWRGRMSINILVQTSAEIAAL